MDTSGYNPFVPLTPAVENKIRTQKGEEHAEVRTT